MIDFLKKLRKKYKKSKQIHLILDGAGYHKSDPVVKIAKKLKIHLVYLPPYILVIFENACFFKLERSQ